MPIAVVIVLIIALLGAGAYFFTRDDAAMEDDMATTTEEAARVEDTGADDIEMSDEENEDDEEAATTTEVVGDETTTDTSPEAEVMSYADGTYSATATYLTPRRTTHEVEVTVTLDGDVVTAADVLYDGKPAGEYSNDYQRGFDAAYEAQVIGTKLDDISLSRMGGSSLTPQGFNDALARIQEEASV